MLKRNLDFDKNLLRVKSLLIAFPILLAIFLVIYSTVEYLLFNPNELTFTNVSTKIYDKNNTFLWEISKDNSVRNTPIDISVIPENCKNAIVAIEDKTFWTNTGIDTNGMGRLVISLFTDGSAGGGSTISQQVIKNAYQRIYNRSPFDKLNEIIAAVKLNRYFDKDKILEMYMNNVYFGNLNYGVETASEDYFGKNVSDLNLAECSYLMGIPQFPGVYNPYGDVAQGKLRQKDVLDAMVRNEYITSSEENDALDFELKFNLSGFEVRAPHFIQYLQDKYSIFKDNSDSFFNKSAIIKTSYDYDLHKKILAAAKDIVANYPDKNLNNASIIVLDKNSKILTMIGSVDYFNDDIDGKFNSTLGLRQPGTALIPLIYSIALQNHTSDMMYPNLPFEITVKRALNVLEKVPVANHDKSESLSVNLNDAIAGNLEIPSVHVIQEYDPAVIMDNLQSLKFTKQNNGKQWCNEVAILEGCEVSLLNLTQIYSAAKSDTPYEISDLTQVQQRGSEITKTYSDNALDLSSQIISSLNKTYSILKTHENSGWVEIKGDTDNFKDTFAIGMNENYTVGVWAGNTKGTAITGLKSDDAAIPILDSIIKLLH